MSLAGGIPAPESFPLELFGELTSAVSPAGAPPRCDRTEGFARPSGGPGSRLSLRRVHPSADQILVTSGSQGILDALGKVLIAPGDAVAVEAPTYLGALQAWNAYEPRPIGP